MTIFERYAKYSIEELKNALDELTAKIKQEQEYMEEFRQKKNIEMFRMAEDLYNENSEIYLNVKCAYNSRVSK